MRLDVAVLVLTNTFQIVLSAFAVTRPSNRGPKAKDSHPCQLERPTDEVGQTITSDSHLSKTFARS